MREGKGCGDAGPTGDHHRRQPARSKCVLMRNSSHVRKKIPCGEKQGHFPRQSQRRAFPIQPASLSALVSACCILTSCLGHHCCLFWVISAGSLGAGLGAGKELSFPADKILPSTSSCLLGGQPRPPSLLPPAPQGAHRRSWRLSAWPAPGLSRKLTHQSGS